MGFVRNTTYYTGVVYEWNLPTGTTCPFADECRVEVDRFSGKFKIEGGYFHCYSASSERFPSVREHRWLNYEFIRNGGKPEPPKEAKNIRIHAGGDFFNQKYFDTWLDVVDEHPFINFWAFTKSIPYWLERDYKIPKNLILTASYGGKYDFLIDQFHLKSARVYSDPADIPEGMPIDTNDDWARVPLISFALLDNRKFKKKA